MVLIGKKTQVSTIQNCLLRNCRLEGMKCRFTCPLNNKNGKKDCLLLPISNLIPALLIFQCNDGKYPRLSIQYPTWKL